MNEKWKRESAQAIFDAYPGNGVIELTPEAGESMPNYRVRICQGRYDALFAFLLRLADDEIDQAEYSVKLVEVLRRVDAVRRKLAPTPLDEDKRPVTAMQADAERSTVTVNLEGGLVQDVLIYGLPANVEVFVRDFDEGWDPERGDDVRIGGDGREYCFQEVEPVVGGGPQSIHDKKWVFPSPCATCRNSDDPPKGDCPDCGSPPGFTEPYPAADPPTQVDAELAESCTVCGSQTHPPCTECGKPTRCDHDEKGKPLSICDSCDAQLEHPELTTMGED